MEKNVCQEIRSRITKCIKPCPLLEAYANQCDVLCNHNDNLDQCKIFISLVALIIPPSKKK